LYEELYQDDRLCAKGTATYVHFNFALQKPEPIPFDVREKLNEHLMDDTKAAAISFHKDSRTNKQ
jgi:acyl-CoA thioester hydrolase